MTTLRCLAVDDEPLALELLVDNIRQVPFLELVSACNSAMDTVQVMHREPVDLIFTDIQMPGLNGLQLINTLAAKPMFILITAHAQFAVEGYALDVVDYLLKPVAFDRFMKACTKALERHTLRHAAPVVNAPERSFIFVPVDYRMVKIMLADIVRLEGLRDYIRIHFSGDKRPMLVRIAMKAIEDMLPGRQFIRVHKSHIVSIGSISAVRKSSVFIGEEELPVSEQYRDALQQLIEGR